ncbi:MAG TPA: zinc-dependent metalloprotease [Solirubrobacteraceae bacterium]
MEAIDWGTAQRIGELIAGSPPYDGVRLGTVEPRAHDFAARVSDYSLLSIGRELPALELVDRSSWIAANLRSMRPLLAPLTDKLGEQRGLLAGPMRSFSGLLLGAQIGALTGMLSQRVLGQYDLALLDDSVPPRLLLLAPNLAQAARNLGVDRDELLLWVTIHEITHAVQFSGAPWLRAHLAGMIEELLDGLQVTLGIADEADGNGDGGGSGKGEDEGKDGGGLTGLLGRFGDVGELRSMMDLARRGELMRLTIGEERWGLVERMQATMSLIEGHAEHTMDAVGAEVLPSLATLRSAMTRRRTQRGLPWRVLERLLGLELKMRQYEQGRRFCDAVVAEAGPEGLARAWRSAEALPTPAELEKPAEWVARTAPLAA